MIGLHHQMSYSPAAQQMSQQQHVASIGQADEKKVKHSLKRAQKQQQQTLASTTIEQFRSSQEPDEGDYVLERRQLSTMASRQLLMDNERRTKQQVVQVPAQTHAISQVGAMLLLAPNCRKSRAHPTDTINGAIGHSLSADQHQPLQMHSNNNSLQLQYDDQVLLIVNEDHKRGGGIPIIGRRLPSKSASARHLLEGPHQSNLLPDAPIQSGNAYLTGPRGQVIGRRSNRILLQQQQQQRQQQHLQSLQSPINVELPQNDCPIPMAKQNGETQMSELVSSRSVRSIRSRNNEPPIRGDSCCALSCCQPSSLASSQHCLLPCCNLAYETGIIGRSGSRSRSASNLRRMEADEELVARARRRQKRRSKLNQQPLVGLSKAERDQQSAPLLVPSYNALLLANQQQRSGVIADGNRRQLDRARSHHSARREPGQHPSSLAPPIPAKPPSFQATDLRKSVGPRSVAQHTHEDLLASQLEDQAVTQMYESLAAELKAKLGDPRAAPILLPPKDYDTLSRKQGKLNGIELRRSTNPQLVGPTSATLTTPLAKQGAPKRTQANGSTSGRSPTRSSSCSSSQGLDGLTDAGSLGSSHSAHKSRPPDEDCQEAHQHDQDFEEDDNRHRSLSNSSSGLGSISLGARSSPSAISSGEECDSFDARQKEKEQPNGCKNGHREQQPSVKTAIKNDEQTNSNEQFRAANGIENHNPAKVSSGSLWNGRVEVPLKVNSERKNGGQTYLATKQIIY